MRCPVGFEATADEQSCQSCTFGTYNPGSKGKRQKPCTSCCGKNNPDCRKRWTLNTGAKAKDECIGEFDSLCAG